MKDLSAQDAVKAVRGDALAISQISNDRCMRILGREIKHIDLLSSVAPESTSVSIVAEIEYMASNVVNVSFQKLFNVVAINALAAAFSVVGGIDGDGAMQKTRPWTHSNATQQALKANALSA
jgi:hypothetical protein